MSGRLPASPELDLAADLAADLRLAVARLARRIRLTETGGLTPSQISALSTIDRRGPARLVDVAAAEGVAAPTAARIVVTLETAGLIHRAPDPDDRRATRLSVTSAGRRELDRIRRHREAFLEQRLAELSPADVAALVAALPVLRRLAGEAEVTS